MNTAYLILGSNIGNRLNYLNKSIEQISLRTGEIVKSSSVYESEPWGFDDNTNFYNQIVQINTMLNAQDLLKLILQIETELGRERKEGGYSSRTIDIDILFFNNECINKSDLIIPHPRLHQRIFTLLPLNEIASNYIHPIFNKDVKTLLSECEDSSVVKRIS